MTAKVKIVEVTSPKLLKSFINLPWKLYKNNKSWVPPLKITLKEMFSPKHPFYKTSKMKMWLAVDEHNPSDISGRIAAIVNDSHNQFHNESCGFFGFFESVDDQNVSSALLETAEVFLKDSGMDCIRGPMNPSTNYECGMLIDGFDDPPQIMMTFNPPFYKSLLEGSNYAKATDLLAFHSPINIEMPQKIVKIAQRAEGRANITYRPIDMKKWNQEIDTIYDIYTSAWEKNWGFVPMPKEEFLHTAKDMKSIVDKRMIIFAEINGIPAGFLLALPDYNQVFKRIPNGKLLPTGIFKLLRGKKYIDRIRVITMGVKEEYRHLGLASLMYQKIQQVAKEAGYVDAEMSWILEDNLKMVRPLQLMGPTLIRPTGFLKKI